MTVDEAIKELIILSNAGHGELPLRRIVSLSGTLGVAGFRLAHTDLGRGICTCEGSEEDEPDSVVVHGT